MSGDGTVRDVALEAIRAGKLPARSPTKTWGGQGSGSPCAICGEQLRPDDLELELEFATNDGTRRESYLVHVGCSSAWDAARLKLESDRDAMATVGLSSTGDRSSLAVDAREAPIGRGGL
jgi:hypothetical protein